MNFFAPFIRRPIGTSLLAAGLTLAGAIAYMLLGVAALPSIEVPAVFIQTQMPGANAQTMASTIIAPLERMLGKPVLTANQVTMCSALARFGAPAMGDGQRLVLASRPLVA